MPRALLPKLYGSLYIEEPLSGLWSAQVFQENYWSVTDVPPSINQAIDLQQLSQDQMSLNESMSWFDEMCAFYQRITNIEREKKIYFRTSINDVLLGGAFVPLVHSPANGHVHPPLHRPHRPLHRCNQPAFRRKVCPKKTFKRGFLRLAWAPLWEFYKKWAPEVLKEKKISSFKTISGS